MFQGPVAGCQPGMRESLEDRMRVQVARPLLAPVVFVRCLL